MIFRLESKKIETNSGFGKLTIFRGRPQQEAAERKTRGLAWWQTGLSISCDLSRVLWHTMAISDITKERAMSLNVSLPPELENRVRQHVESGLYGSASEVIREALRLFEAYQGIRAASLSALQVDIAQGMADTQAGRVREVSMSSIKERGRAALAKSKAA